MAQLLSPVCTEAIRFQNSPGVSFSNSTGACRGVFFFRTSGGCWRNPAGGGGRRRGFPGVVAAAAGVSPSSSSDAVADDYYSVLGLLPDATPAQIKKAYYNCMKACHPDLSGNDPETTNFCMFINEVYAVLSDPLQRIIYDEIHGYALTAVNPFLDDSCPKDHVFVDEFSCIGCKNCANVASDVFGIEEEYGRARAYSQCGQLDLVQQAIDSCPVDCIHWTSAPQLSLLEDEMRRVERVNVAFMLSGMGSGGVDVFKMASTRWEKRQAKVLGEAKIRMTKQKGADDKSSMFWNNLWGQSKERRSSDEEANERARRAAAAARRWREYSRKGVDKPPTYKLPEAVSKAEKGYYRCSSSKGCPARKQVERSRSDPAVLLVTYSSDHNHPLPAARNQQQQQPPASTKSEPEEDSASASAEANGFVIADIGEDSLIDDPDFNWLAEAASSSAISFPRRPIYAGSDYSAAAFSMGEEDESLFGDLGELPECSLVYRLAKPVEPEETNCRCGLSPVPCFGNAV